MSEMILEVNGVPYGGFIEASAEISMLNMSGSFTFTVSVLNNLTKFPITIGSACRVLVDGQPVITGWIEKININYDSTGHTISISGRDKTCDVIDSTIGENSLSLTSAIGLIDITKMVLNYLGITDIKVSSTVDTPIFNITEIGNITPETGESAFEFVEKFAQQRQVLPTTDGNGNIIFTRTGNTVLKTVLTSSPSTQSTILSASVDYDYTKRFYKYVLSTQMNPVNLSIVTDVNHPDAEKQTTVVSTAYDKGSGNLPPTRKTRTYNLVQSDSSYNNLKYLQDRAWYEANFRRSRSFVYNATVQGFTPLNDKGFIWRPNYMVSVQDDYCNIDSILLINSVKFNYSADSGSTTTLELIDRDSYTIDVLLGIKYQNKYKKAKQGNSVISDLKPYQGK